jgi:hypothetical protein
LHCLRSSRRRPEPNAGQGLCGEASDRKSTDAPDVIQIRAVAGTGEDSVKVNQHIQLFGESQPVRRGLTFLKASQLAKSKSALLTSCA